MTTPCAEQDFLEQDRPIPGQNFACLSFLSPEQVLERKEVFFFRRFIEAFSRDMRVLVEGLKEQYPQEADGIRLVEERHAYMFQGTAKSIQEEYETFVAAHPQLEKEFHETNDFQTSIRGIKVRGVYDTLREAQVRAEVLKRTDKAHPIYIAQVGAWCPWSPHPDQIPNQEYAETHLNTLMKKYAENQIQREEYYQARKEALRKDAMRRAAELTAKTEAEAAAAATAKGGVSLDYTDTMTATVEPAASETETETETATTTATGVSVQEVMDAPDTWTPSSQ